MSWMLPLTVNSGTLQIRIPSNTMAIPNNVDKKAKGRETDSMVCFAAKFSFIQNSTVSVETPVSHNNTFSGVQIT